MGPKWRGGGGRGWNPRGGGWRGGSSRGRSGSSQGSSEGDSAGRGQVSHVRREVRDVTAADAQRATKAGSGSVLPGSASTTGVASEGPQLHVRESLQLFLRESCLPPTIVSAQPPIAGAFGGQTGAADSQALDRQTRLQHASAELSGGDHLLDGDQAAFGGILTQPPVGAKGRQVYALEVDMVVLLDYCPTMWEVLRQRGPQGFIDAIKTEYVQLWHDELRALWGALFPRLRAVEDSGILMGLAVRLTHVPPILEVPQVSFHECGRLVRVTGTLIRLCAPRLVPFVTKLMCKSCGVVVELPSDPHCRGDIIRVRCSSAACKGEPLKVLSQIWMDYTEGRLQQLNSSSSAMQRLLELLATECEDPSQQPAKLHQHGDRSGLDLLEKSSAGGAPPTTSGRLPRSVLVALDDDLVSKASVGDVVDVVGIAKLRWSQVGKDRVPQAEVVISVVNLMPVGDKADALASADDGTAGGVGRFDPAAFIGQFYSEDSDGGDMSTDSGGADSLRATLVRSVCPHLCGLFAPRLGVLLAALGGQSVSAKGMRVRGTTHLLFVGDPSTGKSQLLKFSAAIAPRSTSTTGMTSSSAGLTVAATKEFGEWALEPGALVLSDGGTCVIDELRTINASDRSALHEAMEQQTISVAKAGIVARLRTMCSVVAACNPPAKGQSRSRDSVSGPASIGIGAALLSRFDLIFLLFDDQGGDQAKDAAIAGHILAYAQKAAAATAADTVYGGRMMFERFQPTTGGGFSSSGDVQELTVQEMKQYLTFVRRWYRPVASMPVAAAAASTSGGGHSPNNSALGDTPRSVTSHNSNMPEGRGSSAMIVKPQLSTEAAELLSIYYAALRHRGPSASLSDAVPVTIRLLESLIRITQAHAKLVLHEQCTLDDAAMALFVMERTAHALKLPLENLAFDTLRGCVCRMRETDGSDRFAMLYTSSLCVDRIFFGTGTDDVRQQQWYLRDLAGTIQGFAAALLDAGKDLNQVINEVDELTGEQARCFGDDGAGPLLLDFGGDGDGGGEDGDANHRDPLNFPSGGGDDEGSLLPMHPPSNGRSGGPRRGKSGRVLLSAFVSEGAPLSSLSGPALFARERTKPSSSADALPEKRPRVEEALGRLEDAEMEALPSQFGGGRERSIAALRELLHHRSSHPPQSFPVANIVSSAAASQRKSDEHRAKLSQLQTPLCEVSREVVAHHENLTYSLHREASAAAAASALAWDSATRPGDTALTQQQQQQQQQQQFLEGATQLPLQRGQQAAPARAAESVPPPPQRQTPLPSVASRLARKFVIATAAPAAQQAPVLLPVKVPAAAPPQRLRPQPVTAAGPAQVGHTGSAAHRADEYDEDMDLDFDDAPISVTRTAAFLPEGDGGNAADLQAPPTGTSQISNVAASPAASTPPQESVRAPVRDEYSVISSLPADGAEDSHTRHTHNREPGSEDPFRVDDEEHPLSPAGGAQKSAHTEETKQREELSRAEQTMRRFAFRGFQAPRRL